MDDFDGTGRGERATPDNGDLERAHFGHLLEQMPLPTELQRCLMGVDGSRAATLINLMLPPLAPMALPALDMLLLDAKRLLEWVEDLGESPQRELAQRVLNDLTDAIDGLLLARGSRVLDACRDLMELAVLFRDFRREPHRFAKWQRVAEDKRGTDFGFGALLWKYPDEVLPYLGPNIEALSVEYAMHSRSLHPAMYLGGAQELSRGLMEGVDAALLMGSYVTEICRHGASALDGLAAWMVTAHPTYLKSHPLEMDLIDPDSAATRWMAQWREMEPEWTEERIEAHRRLTERMRKTRRASKEGRT